jgi:predicted DNA-binding transcriptional regulator AlpA
MRLLSDVDLKEKKGIDFTRDHRRRLIEDGKFPKPVKPGGGINARNAWLEHEIDQYLADLAAARDSSSAERPSDNSDKKPQTSPAQRVGQAETHAEERAPEPDSKAAA